MSVARMSNTPLGRQISVLCFCVTVTVNVNYIWPQLSQVVTFHKLTQGMMFDYYKIFQLHLATNELPR